MTRAPRDPVREGLDDEPTARELGVPTYESAPPTIEARISPFHRMESLERTSPGMPPPIALDPRITSAPGSGPVALAPPVILGAHDLAGATDPDGHPISGSWDLPTDPHLGVSPWADPAPIAPVSPRPAPAVPAPGSPTFELSQSLELEVTDRIVPPAPAHEPAPKPRPRRYHVPQAGPGPHAPTYQMLPALSRDEKKEREGSDWPLVLGLLALALVIAGLVGAVAYGVARSVQPDPAPAPAAPR